ncbi:hypothetical protein AX14_010986 [Amanita brunnescens Koide BX004]|nr:hypothetical protein AX14_010986 [Amanita brunnescens Koide BX004]
MSGFLKGLYTQLGITANPSTTYHPQMDGQTECVNQELEEYLRIYVNEKQNGWILSIYGNQQMTSLERILREKKYNEPIHQGIHQPIQKELEGGLSESRKSSGSNEETTR